MRTRWALVALLLLAACSAPHAVQRAAARPVARSYSLATGARLFAWTRPHRADAPWLLYVHGGAWLRGRGDSPTAYALAAHELRRGYQVFSVDYRLSGVARWPAQRNDVTAAVDAIRAGASGFGISARRGVIVGESAGGQLAAVVASRGGFAGLVDLAGAVDPQAALHAPDRALGTAAEQLVGCPPVSCPTRWRDTRAATTVGPATPPTLIVHSADDPIVPASMSRAYADTLQAKGRPVTLRIITGHSHELLTNRAVLRTMDDFAGQVTARG